MTDKTDSPPLAPPELSPIDALKTMVEQITVLGLAMGCTMKSIALHDPERAAGIEANMRLLTKSHDMEGWNPRSKALLDLLYTALNEKPTS